MLQSGPAGEGRARAARWGAVVPGTPLRVGIACNGRTRALYLAPADLSRLARIANVEMIDIDIDAPLWEPTPVIPEIEDQLLRVTPELDALLVCHGGPRVTARVFAGSPRLRLVGELEGDRFAGRIDVAAAVAAGVTVVDTTHSSSWPVAEWALALALLGLRQHGRFRDIVAGQQMSHSDYRTNPPGRELTGKTVGLIGFGHIAWRLCELLAPFQTPIVAHDPYAPRELADALHVDLAPLEVIMRADVVVCLAPATPGTRGLIGVDELDLLRPDAVFVNVSRGVVVDVPALIARAARGDAWFGLDAHDPEPIAVGSPLRAMRNVFLSPHLGGVTAEATTRFFSLMVDELTRYVSGVEPRAQITERVMAGRRGSP